MKMYSSLSVSSLADRIAKTNEAQQRLDNADDLPEDKQFTFDHYGDLPTIACDDLSKQRYGDGRRFLNSSSTERYHPIGDETINSRCHAITHHSIANGLCCYTGGFITKYLLLRLAPDTRYLCPVAVHELFDYGQC